MNQDNHSNSCAKKYIPAKLQIINQGLYNEEGLKTPRMADICELWKFIFYAFFHYIFINISKKPEKSQNIYLVHMKDFPISAQH